MIKYLKRGKGVQVRADDAPSLRPPEDVRSMRLDYYRYVADGSANAPVIVVMEDADDRPGTGSFWGEVNSALHEGLGVACVPTNDSVRDLGDLSHSCRERVAFACACACARGGHWYAGDRVWHGGCSWRPDPCRPARRGGDRARVPAGTACVYRSHAAQGSAAAGRRTQRVVHAGHGRLGRSPLARSYRAIRYHRRSVPS